MNSSACIRVFAGAASVLATIGIGALAAGPVSHAAIPEMNPPSVRVRFSDLDLSKPGGVKTLKMRIQHAAERVCDQTVTSNRTAMAQYFRCIHEATAQAFDKVGLADR